MGKKQQPPPKGGNKHRAHAAKKKAGGRDGRDGGKNSIRKQGLAHVLQNNTNVQLQTAKQSAAFAPPKLNATKQLNAQRLKQKREELRQMKVPKHRGTEQSLEELMGRASQTNRQFEQKEQKAQHDRENGNEIEINDNSRRAYMKELRKVVDRADVILQVLDARDPMGCRSMEMEEAIGNRSGKKIVLVLNKIDLVPPQVLQPWLNYLRTFYPTVAFKASTQNQASHLSQTFGRADKASSEALTGSKAVGTEALMQLLKNYCRNNHIKTAITVGVIGYPNVGKSSVINSLKRSKAASVSSTAGHTKVMQEVHIDSKIKLLDCPGIVFDHSDANALLLRNCINTETMDDPIGAVQVLLSRCEPAQLIQLYGLDPSVRFQDVIEFLVLVASAKGKLGKGGIPDRHAAARIILQDWNRGKIPFFTPPPEQKHTILDTQIVSSFSSDFEIDNVLNPTSVFLPEHAECTATTDEAMDDTTDGHPVGPQCSLEVATSTAEAQSTTAMTRIKIEQVMKNLDDSDDSDDSDLSDQDDDDIMDDVENVIPSSSSFKFQTPSLQKLTQDALNPQTALMARRKAKAWRKLKRRAARQQIGAAEESSFCQQLEQIGIQMQPATSFLPSSS